MTMFEVYVKSKYKQKLLDKLSDGWMTKSYLGSLVTNQCLLVWSCSCNWLQFKTNVSSMLIENDVGDIVMFVI